MGVVFLAYDPELDRKVALKLLRLGLLDREGKQRLVREAQALARLSHPNVVPVYDVGTVENQAFVAMEYVEGQTLKRWLKTPRAVARRRRRHARRRARPRRRARRRAGASRLQARQRAHRRRRARARRRLRPGARGRGSLGPSGVTPADRPDGKPVPRPPLQRRVPISGGRDEHLSLSQVTRADQVIGTPAYMAPEQVANGACDDRADQFSFGVTFYEALYRQRPYDVTETIDGDALLDHGREAAPKRAHHRRRAAARTRRAVVGAAHRHARAVAQSHRSLPDRWMRCSPRSTSDPALTRRRVATVMAMIVVLGLGAVGFVRGQAAKRRLCEGALDEVHKAWSPETRERVRLAFAATEAVVRRPGGARR